MVEQVGQAPLVNDIRALTVSRILLRLWSFSSPSFSLLFSLCYRLLASMSSLSVLPLSPCLSWHLINHFSFTLLAPLFLPLLLLYSLLFSSLFPPPSSHFRSTSLVSLFLPPSFHSLCHFFRSSSLSPSVVIHLSFFHCFSFFFSLFTLPFSLFLPHSFCSLPLLLLTPSSSHQSALSSPSPCTSFLSQSVSHFFRPSPPRSSPLFPFLYFLLPCFFFFYLASHPSDILFTFSSSPFFSF